MKKIISSAIASVMIAASVFTGTVPQKTNTASADTSINYAEALQKSLYFYECQQAGPLPDWNRVEWRADSTMGDFITGGWYDAGDHVKFNLPMAYSASMIAWGLYQYPEGIEKCGEMTNYVNNLTFALDYFAACDLGDEVVYQVGNGQDDHSWWGPAELVEYGMKDQNINNERPYYSGRKCSAALGEMAAALASGYCALQGKSDKVNDYLKHAKNIFAIADAEKAMMNIWQAMLRIFTVHLTSMMNFSGLQTGFTRLPEIKPILTRQQAIYLISVQNWVQTN